MVAEQSSPHLSFKEVKSNGDAAYVTDAAHRLYWPLADVFPANISVMKSRRGGLDEREPFCRPDGTWHEIASLPVTEPKVSSIEVSIRDLDQWESDWVAWHENHENHEAAEYVTYGDLDDEDRPYAYEQHEDGSWEDDSDTEFLIRCCGQDRPLRTRGQRLQVTPSAGKDFVSIHDYVCGMSSIRLNETFLTITISRSSMADGFTRGYYTSKNRHTPWTCCCACPCQHHRMDGQHPSSARTRGKDQR